MGIALLAISPTAFAQSQNFEGVGVSLDYGLFAIKDKSTPGSSITSNSGIPAVTLDYYHAVTDKVLLGGYFTYDLVSSDTYGSDPDAQHPMELGAKAAYAVTDSLIGYVKLGYAWTRFSSPGFYQIMRGPAFGIGAEYLWTKNIFTRVEIARQNYKQVNWSDGTADKVNIDSYTVSVGYRF
ncbi:outer membrane beta-barrel protein [Herbaspirillum sp. RTI4]|nr:outer membrane beta-barrel protein [Herbaspirillum sp. RTI4]